MIRTIPQYSLAAVLALLYLASSVLADQGPLPVQNRFPLYLLFLTPRPTSAALPPKGALEIRTALDYSRINLHRRSEQWEVIQDMEMAVVDFSLKYALSSRLALRLDVPLVSMNSGFLDPYVNGYHDALNLPNYGPDNTFIYEVSKGRQSWLEGDPGGLQVADITLSGQWSILRTASGRGWCSSLLGSIKMPTGDPHWGYGSGRIDAGLFVPSQWSGHQWSFYLMPGAVWPGNPDAGGVDVRARRSLSLFAGTAYAHNEKWQWLLQGNYFSSPLEYTGISKMDEGAFEMTIGVRYSFSRHWCYEFGFSEDIFTKAAPDFTFHFGLIWNYKANGSGA